MPRNITEPGLAFQVVHHQAQSRKDAEVPEHHARIVATNGNLPDETVWWTENYTDERSAYNAIELLDEFFAKKLGIEQKDIRSIIEVEEVWE